jgi:iron complex transport system substrate-binding protein
VRIVTLACSNTEIVCALGCADQLVGVDEHSDYPETVVAKLPKVGPDLGVDVAKVAALKPDLVIASLTVPGHERIVEDLEKAGLPVVALEPVSIADVHANVCTIASLLGIPERGAALAEQMDRDIPAPLAGEDANSRPRILVEWWPRPVICPTRGSWVNQLLASAGAVNPLSDREGKSETVSVELANELAPDAVVISWCGIKTEKYRPSVVYDRPGWESIPAVRNRRVYCVPEAYLGRPGPRLIDGYRAFKRIANELASATAILA